MRLLALLLLLLPTQVLAQKVGRGDWNILRQDRCVFPDQNGVLTCTVGLTSYTLSATSSTPLATLVQAQGLVGEVPYSQFYADSCLRPDGTGVRHCPSPDGTKLFSFPATTTTPVSPPLTTLPLVSSLSALPGNLLFAIDANEPVTYNAAPAAGAPGLQLNTTNGANSVAQVNDLITYQAYSGGSHGSQLFLGSGPNGFNFFRDNPNNAYDNFVPPAANFGSAFGPTKATWWAMGLVNQQIGALDLFRAQNGGYTIQQIVDGVPGATDCSLYIDQNNGTAHAYETSSTLTACGQWEVLLFGTDGSKLYIWRNGTLTASGSGTPIGFSNLGPTNVEFANQCNCESVFWMLGAGLPTQTAMNAFLTQVYAQYGISGGQQLTTWPTTTGIAPSVVDQTSSYLTTPNFPTANAYATSILPVNSAAVPSDGLVMTSGTTNTAYMSFGTGATGAGAITTNAQIRSYFFMNYLTGAQNTAIGEPEDGNAGNYNARARHYAVGDPNDLHVIASDGMHLRAICSNNHTACGPGHVYAAMVRPSFQFTPGMTVEWDFQGPGSNNGWAPMWFYSGEQDSPGPGGNAYTNFGQPTSLYRGGAGPCASNGSNGPVSCGNQYEIDASDNFPRNQDLHIPLGENFNFGTPDTYEGDITNVKPYAYYAASQYGFQFYGTLGSPTQIGSTGNGAPAEKDPHVNCATSICRMVMSWRGDGSNLIDLFVNGVLIQTCFMEFNSGNDEMVTTPSGTKRPLALHTIMGNQAIPSFVTGYNATDTFTTENDGVLKANGAPADGWDLIIQKFAVWNGNVATPSNYVPTN